MNNGQSPSFTAPPFVQFMLTVIPAGIVVVAGWLFGNIFAELQHQRQRQESLVTQVTALQRDLIALTSQFEDVRLFYRNRLVANESEVIKLQKGLQRVETELRLSNQKLGLEAIREMSGQPANDELNR